MNKIRKTNFHFGTDKAGYGQTTQQYNNNITERSKGLNLKQKPALDREKLQITHFIMGKQIFCSFILFSKNQIHFTLGSTSPDYKTTSNEYDLTAEGIPKHVILQKGKAKDTSHNFTYGHNKPIYKSTNTESYKKVY
jgi:hypothetical protein